MNPFEVYYLNQAGGGGSLPYFQGIRYARGHGLGGVLGSLFRAAVPVLKKSGKALLKEGLQTGVNVIGDVLEGQNIKSAMKRRAKDSGQRLLHQAKRRVVGAHQRPVAHPRRRHAIKRSAPSRHRHTSTRRKKNRSTSGDIFS